MVIEVASADTVAAMQTTQALLTAAILILSACPGDDAPPMADSSTGSSGPDDPSTSTTSTGPEPTTAEPTTSPDTTEGVDSTTAEPGSSSDSAGTDSTTGEPPSGGYGDCANFDDACLPEEACLYDGFRGVCSSQGCETVADCPVPTLDGPMPPSASPAEVVCMDATGRGEGDCFFECSVGLTNGCPEGMTCVGLGDAAICMWPGFPPGGGACPDLDIGNRQPQSIMGNNAGAGDDHFPLCSFASGEDYIVQWGPAPVDGGYTFDTIGSSALPGGFDTTLAVLDACPGPDAIEIGCGNNQSGTDSGVTVNLVEGQSVFLVVDSQFGNTGPFVLNVQ
jgi:hypothetical protein